MLRVWVAGGLVLLCLTVMALARLSLRARPSWLRWFPKPLAHRWTLAGAAGGAVVLFFSGPFFVLGFPVVALAGGGVAVLLLTFGAPDVLAWVQGDLHAHRATGRSWFEHSVGCAAHPGHGDSVPQADCPSEPMPAPPGAATR